MPREQLLDHMADMAALPFGNCLENVNMDRIRYKDLRDFKGYSFHSFYLLMGIPGSMIPSRCRERVTYILMLYDMK